MEAQNNAEPVGKPIWNYSPHNGELGSAALADPSPLEPGEYLIPAYSTDTAPPTVPSGKVALFNTSDSAWCLVEDIRGTWFGADRQPVQIVDLLDPIGDLTRTEPPSDDCELIGGQWVVSATRRAARIAAARADQWEAIKTERDRRIQLGGYKVGTKWFHSDTFSRTQQMGLFMLGANIPANTPWKTMDGTEVTMTQALAGQIFAAAAQSDIAIFAVAKAHRVAMEALVDPTGYDLTTGWPVIFGE